MTSSGIFDNEASSVDLKVYDELRVLGWLRESKTLLYQPKYDLSPEEQADFPGSKHIKPDFVLQELQGVPLAVIENKLDDPNKALVKLRMKYSRVLRPRFLYACSANKMLFYDMAWRGVDAGEFKPVNAFLSLEEMKQKIQQEQRRSKGDKVAIDTAIAGGYDQAAVKERYYQLECIKTLIEAYRSGKQKMLVHNFTPQQIIVLRKIKDVFIANLSSKGVIDLDAIFANPIYSRLIGRFDEVNQQFDGRLKEVIEEMRGSFKLAA